MVWNCKGRSLDDVLPPAQAPPDMQIMPIVIFIVCTIIALRLLVIANKSLETDKEGKAGLFGILALIAFIAGLPPVQGLGIAVLTGLAKAQFTELSNQVANVQKTTVEMQSQIDTNQAALAVAQQQITNAQAQLIAQQQEITNAQGRLRVQQVLNDSNQTVIATLNSNLVVAESQLRNLEYWVVNLFSNKVVEKFELADTNKVIRVPRGNVVDCFVLLQHAPIPNSVQGRLRGGPLDAERTLIGNVQVTLATPFIELRNELQNEVRNLRIMGDPVKREANLYGFVIQSNLTGEITLEYVRDVRQTNVFKSLQTDKGQLVLDGIPYPTEKP